MTEPQGGLRRMGAFSWIRNLLLRPFRISFPGGVGRIEPGVVPVDDLVREKVRAQANVIRRAFGEKVGIASGDSDDLADVQYFYREDHVLARAEDAGRLRDYFEARGDAYDGTGAVVDEPVQGLVLYALPTWRGTGRVEMEQTLAELDGSLGPGVARPDHVLYVTYKIGSLCPATEPEVPADTTPIPALAHDPTSGKNVHVSVVDTGWYAAAAADADTPWLAHGVSGDLEHVDATNIAPYAGHGTFVSGVIRCLAPGAQIQVEGCLTRGGALYESEIARQLDQALEESPHPQLISVSAGTHTRNDLPLLSFEVLAVLHTLTDGVHAPLFVAAAGNDGNDAPFWPAAFDWVVGVGALDANGDVSEFSNTGDWVDVYALGRDLVNAFPTGTYVCYEPANLGQVRTFSGMARWSGTSFATPMVTGTLAAYLGQHHGTARAAWASVLAGALTRSDKRAGSIRVLGPPFV